MTGKPYFLAFDFGTESVRGAVFDGHGNRVCTEAEAYPTAFPRPGWAEQRPESWWRALLSVADRLTADTRVRSGEIRSIAVDTTSCTVLLLDKDLKPLRDAILWMDVRAFRQAERIAGCGSEILRYNGRGSVSAEWMPSKALWIKENEPGLYERARCVCEFQDWINYRLTGELAASINNTTVRWYYDPRAGGWPADLYADIGLADALEKFPQTILGLGERVGTLRPELARRFGLAPGTPVVQGGIDAYIAMLGLSAVRPGRLACITGSSLLLLGHTETDLHSPGIFGAFPDCVVPGLSVVEGAQASSGSVLKWFKDGFIGREHEEAARAAGVSLYDHLNEQAERIKIGSEGLVVLNDWQGNRNPLVDSLVRGVIWGLSLKHTPAHVYRAIMEAVSYGTEHIMRYLGAAGFEAEEVYACGGATNSRLWMQIQSDVIGLPIHLAEEPNAPLLGDAVLGAYGAGLYGSIVEAAESMVRFTDRIEPDPSRTERYRYYVDRYIDTYPAMTGLMHDMSAHESA